MKTALRGDFAGECKAFVRSKLQERERILRRLDRKLSQMAHLLLAILGTAERRFMGRISSYQQVIHNTKELIGP
jgi:hypothetical protein